MWVMVAVDRHIRTDWRILAQMEKNVLELVASESQSSDEQKDWQIVLVGVQARSATRDCIWA